MNTFNAGDIVCLKIGASPEMLVIGEIEGTVHVFWQDAVGEAMTEELPATSLKAISIENSHLPGAICRVAELLGRR